MFLIPGTPGTLHIGKHRVNQERRPAKSDTLIVALRINWTVLHSLMAFIVIFILLSLFFNGSRGKHFSRSSP